MALAFPDIRVGEPLRHEALTVFPLFTASAKSIDYRLSSEAIADKSVLVQEVDESGSVPDLIVDNRGDTGFCSSKAKNSVAPNRTVF